MSLGSRCLFFTRTYALTLAVALVFLAGGTGLVLAFSCDLQYLDLEVKLL